MGPEDEPGDGFDDDWPDPEPMLPPDDRLWRHPSELFEAVAAPVTPEVTLSRRSETSRRVGQVGALAGACLAGAMVAFGAMWLTRPTRTVENLDGPSRVLATASTVASPFAAGTAPTRRLATAMAPEVALLHVRRGAVWTQASALWVDDHGTLAAAAPSVAGATALMIVGSDGTTQDATLVGIDVDTGLAALHVARTAGQIPEVADQPPANGAAAAVAGAPVASTGSYGEATVASVTVRTASRRSTVGPYVLQDSIQLDRPVPDDATGGALVDAEGRLLGMVVGNATEPPLGTAVPAGTVTEIVADLVTDGQVRRAWLGARAIDLDPAQSSALKVSGGARLTQVTPSSPAATAGLQPGDVLVAIDTTTLRNASDLVQALAHRQRGEPATVRYWRSGRSATVTLTLG